MSVGHGLTAGLDDGEDVVDGDETAGGGQLSLDQGEALGVGGGDVVEEDLRMEAGSGAYSEADGGEHLHGDTLEVGGGE